MQSGASQTEISFEVRFGNSVIRQISVQLQALLDDSPDDKKRGIRKYMSRKTWYSKIYESHRRYRASEAAVLVQ